MYLLGIKGKTKDWNRRLSRASSSPLWMESGTEAETETETVTETQTYQMSVDEFHLNKILIGRQSEQRHPFWGPERPC